MAISPGSRYVHYELGYAYAMAGRRAEAQKELDQLNDFSRQNCVPASTRAAIYAGLGNKDRAFEWLEKGYEEHLIFGDGTADIKVDPMFDPLRSDPRFANLLRRMNLQP